MDDSGVDSMQKLGAGAGPPLRRQASDTNLTSSAGVTAHDYTGARAGGKAGAGGGKRSKSPFAIFRRPKPQDQSPIRAGDMQGRDTMPGMRITVSSSVSICRGVTNL